MRFPFREAKIKPIIVGMLKYSSIMKRILPVSTGGTNNSRYCYSVWFRHLKYLAAYNNNIIPQKIAELGPGDSLGIGLAALLSGSENYYALDIIKYWDNNKNLKIFDDLVALFYKRESIPDNKEFPNAYPILDCYDFPSDILPDEALKKSLAPDRIAAIRSELCNFGSKENSFINYQIPWYDSKVIHYHTLDFIFSQAVLEHIDDLENTYKAMHEWLSPSGMMSHCIDFKSHGFAKSWNGHWTFSDFEWKIIVGGRKYSINRQPFSKHLAIQEKYNFRILEKFPNKSENNLKRSSLAKKFENLSDKDLSTSEVYVLSIKNK